MSVQLSSRLLLGPMAALCFLETSRWRLHVFQEHDEAICAIFTRDTSRVLVKNLQCVSLMYDPEVCRVWYAWRSIQDHQWAGSAGALMCPSDQGPVPSSVRLLHAPVKLLSCTEAFLLGCFFPAFDRLQVTRWKRMIVHLNSQSQKPPTPTNIRIGYMYFMVRERINASRVL